jgi:hypothetical protein
MSDHEKIRDTLLAIVQTETEIHEIDMSLSYAWAEVDLTPEANGLVGDYQKRLTVAIRKRDRLINEARTILGIEIPQWAQPVEDER